MSCEYLKGDQCIHQYTVRGNRLHLLHALAGNRWLPPAKITGKISTGYSVDWLVSLLCRKNLKTTSKKSLNKAVAGL